MIQPDLQSFRNTSSVRCIYIPDNHDNLFRDFEGVHFGEVEIKNQAFHTRVDGKRLLVLHGDERQVVFAKNWGRSCCRSLILYRKNQSEINDKNGRQLKA